MSAEILTELLGKTLTECFQSKECSNDSLHFTTSEGKKYHIYHNQDCSEDVHIDRQEGDLSDLIGSTLLQAEIVSNFEYGEEGRTDCLQWSFVKLATIKGHVVIVFRGTSNGWYGTEVAIYEDIN
jgi:hypothetical protein